MIRCLAIDDEPLALQQIAAYIGKVPFLELAAQCQSALEAHQFLQNDTVDVIFCDINMPDLNGMDFIKALVAPPLVVFTTAYAEYAVEGFKVNAVDYLLRHHSQRPCAQCTCGQRFRRRHHFPQDRLSHCQGSHQRHPLCRGHERIPQSVDRGRHQAHHHPALHEEDGGAPAPEFHAHPPFLHHPTPICPSAICTRKRSKITSTRNFLANNLLFSR